MPRPPPTPPGTVDLFRRQLFFELAPAVQLAHDLGDVHRVGCFPSLGFFLQLPQDDGARAGAQVTPHEREAGAARKERTGRWREATLPARRRARNTGAEAGGGRRESGLGHSLPGKCQGPLRGMSHLKSFLCPWSMRPERAPTAIAFSLRTRKTALVVTMTDAPFTAFRNQSVILTSCRLFLNPGARRVWVPEAFVPQERVGAFVFKSQGSGKEGKSWAVPNGEVPWAEEGGGAWWHCAQAPDELEPLRKLNIMTAGTTLSLPGPREPGQTSGCLTNAGNGEQPTGLEDERFRSNGRLKT